MNFYKAERNKLNYHTRIGLKWHRFQVSATLWAHSPQVGPFYLYLIEVYYRHVGAKQHRTLPEVKKMG